MRPTKPLPCREQRVVACTTCPNQQACSALQSSLVVFSLLAAFNPHCVLALNNGLAKTPPMGYNTWNAFHFNISEDMAKRAADFLVNSGLANAGYVYLVIDDGWMNWKRGPDGLLHWNATKFPAGIPALAKYVHSLGLLFGIYSDAGFLTCGGYAASLGYEEVDARTFASWGVDFVKYDNCYAIPPERVPVKDRYAAMAKAMNRTGKPMVYAMSEWGVSSPWDYGHEMAHMWRTTGDISLSIAASWDGILRCIDNTVGLARFGGPGGWNDADMLEIGEHSGLPLHEQRAHFAMWAVMKSPLMIGADLRNITNEQMDILLAKEVIAVNQDPLGVPGDLVWKQGSEEVWAAPLEGGSRAVVLFNRHLHAEVFVEATLTAHWAHIGLLPNEKASVRDLYARRDLGTYAGKISTAVVNHGARILRITPLRVRREHLEWRPWHCGISTGGPADQPPCLQRNDPDAELALAQQAAQRRGSGSALGSDHLVAVPAMVSLLCISMLLGGGLGFLIAQHGWFCIRIARWARLSCFGALSRLLPSSWTTGKEAPLRAASDSFGPSLLSSKSSGLEHLPLDLMQQDGPLHGEAQGGSPSAMSRGMRPLLSESDTERLSQRKSSMSARLDKATRPLFRMTSSGAAPHKRGSIDSIVEEPEA